MGSIVTRVRSGPGRMGSVAIAGLLAIAGVLVGTGSGEPDVLAFDRVWSLQGCTNVAQVSTQYRFMDDAPGAADGTPSDANNESVFISVNANDANAEQCTWWTQLDVQADMLVVWAAVNDGAALRVSANSGANCNSALDTVVFSGSSADNAFRRKFSDGWTRQRVRAVCVTLADSPASATRRISALLDRVWVFDGSSTIWQENFGRTG